jgi:hypothetical protein
MLYDVALILEAVQLYFEEGIPFKVIFIMFFIFDVSMKTYRLNVRTPYKAPLFVKVCKVYVNGSTLHYGAVDVHGTHTKFEFE